LLNFMSPEKSLRIYCEYLINHPVLHATTKSMQSIKNLLLYVFET